MQLAGFFRVKYKLEIKLIDEVRVIVPGDQRQFFDPLRCHIHD